MSDINQLNQLSTQIRRDILRMVHGCKSGHPGGSLGCADFFTALFFHVMDHNPAFHMDAKGEDLFFLSNGHISPVYYSTLARAGYFPVEELKTFRRLNSRLQGHPATHEHLPGIRIATGSLGQGLSVAVGAALTKKFLKAVEEDYFKRYSSEGQLNVTIDIVCMTGWAIERYAEERIQQDTPKTIGFI